MSRFSDEARRHTAPLREAIHALPFNAELAAGTLGRECFQHYITQDALYLGQFSRALAIAAAKAPDTGTLQAFAQSAWGPSRSSAPFTSTICVVWRRSRRARHRGAGARLPRLYQLSVGHGLSRSVGSVGRGVAAVLLDLLGCRLRHRRPGRADNPYRAWIDTYADPRFGEAVQRVVATADRAADATTAAERTRMLAAFTRALNMSGCFARAYQRRSCRTPGDTMPAAPPTCHPTGPPFRVSGPR